MNRQKAILIVKNNWPENPNILGEEKIRKWIVRTLKSLNNSSIQIDGAYEMMLPAIAWLEKQGGQKPIDKIQLGKKYKCIASPRYSTFMKGEIYKPEDKFLCSLMNFCYDCFEPIEDGELKPADKVIKSKFHEGDWVIGRATENEPRQIAEIKKEGYKTTYGGWIGFSFEEDMRLWTIEDAKSGDVLYTPKGCGVEGIFIVDDWKKVEDTGRTLCCNIGYRVENDEIVAGGLGAIWWKGVIDPFYPATKEQKELLFNKIRENGFEYDSKKNRYIKKRVPKEYAIIIDGVRHNLIKPKIEDCKKCSLDKFCDKFKEALCDSLVGRHTDMIFEKVE